MVETAAVALLHGWSDPMGLLGTPMADWPIAVAVVGRAQELRTEERKRELDYVASHTAAPIVEGVAKVVRNALRALRNR